ncbi:hypothetical protein P3T73_03850 [Kiritimatiellota bacterium B12222]|nr:hypothetical protein P3T73_03850 [Kiritimatiellota bacterium B12222]
MKFPLHKTVVLKLSVLLCVGGMVYAEPVTEMVTQVYLEVWGSQPDPQELEDLSLQVKEQNWTTDELRSALRTSDAYCDALIIETFENVLGRAPDEGALETYRVQLQAGWTEKQLRQRLRNSAEYRDKYKHQCFE